MKKILLAILPAALLWACGPSANVKIKGEIEGSKGLTAKLEKLHVENREFIDSVKIGKSEEFNFKAYSKTPEFYILSLSNGETITLAAYPDENIEISGKAEKFSSNYWVDGSDASLNIKVLNFKLERAVAELKSLKTQLDTIQDNTRREDLNAKIKDVFLDQKRFVREFIIKNAPSLSSYMALYQEFAGDYTLNENSDIYYFKVVASSLKALWPESEYTESVLLNLQEMEKRLASANIKSIIDKIGEDIPEISLPDINGKERKLSSLKGKYILVDFTVMSDPKAAVLNKQLKDTHRKFRSKGFTVYQIALDKNENLWKRGYKAQNIDWINVWDKNSSRSTVAGTWNIKQLPANYLISPKSEIVGKNLFGDKLDDRLKNLMN